VGKLDGKRCNFRCWRNAESYARTDVSWETIPDGRSSCTETMSAKWQVTSCDRQEIGCGGMCRCSSQLTKSGVHVCVCALTGQLLASTVQAEQNDVNQAVASARKAFETWGRSSGHYRARILYRSLQSIALSLSSLFLSLFLPRVPAPALNSRPALKSP